VDRTVPTLGTSQDNHQCLTSSMSISNSKLRQQRGTQWVLKMRPNFGLFDPLKTVRIFQVQPVSQQLTLLARATYQAWTLWNT